MQHMADQFVEIIQTLLLVCDDFGWQGNVKHDFLIASSSGIAFNQSMYQTLI
jgi:hypothetical protein